MDERDVAPEPIDFTDPDAARRFVAALSHQLGQLQAQLEHIKKNSRIQVSTQWAESTGARILGEMRTHMRQARVAEQERAERPDEEAAEPVDE